MKNKEVMVWGKEVKQVSRSKKREQWKNQHTRKNSGKKKVKGGLIWILPLWGAFYVMLSSSSGRAEIRGSLFFYFFPFPCFFFFSFFFFFFFFSSEKAEIRGVFLLRHRALNFFCFSFIFLLLGGRKPDVVFFYAQSVKLSTSWFFKFCMEYFRLQEKC